VRVRDNGAGIAPEIRGQIVPALCHDKTDRRRRAPWIKLCSRKSARHQHEHLGCDAALPDGIIA